MNRTTVEKLVIRAISTALGVGEREVGPDDKLVDDLGVDTDHKMTLIVNALEREFNPVMISVEDSRKFKTVRNIFGFVNHCVKQGVKFLFIS